MKTPHFAVALLPTLAFTLLQPCFGQTEALLRAPLPAASVSSSDSSSALPNDPAFVSSSALPGNPAFMPGYYPVERAPQPVEVKPKLKMLDWSLIGAASMLRVLDYTSTEQALANPAHLREAMLPTALVENKPAFAAFEAATVGVNYEAYRLMVHHHMRSLARVGQYVYVSAMAFTVTRNYQAIGSVPAAPGN
ncbi:MAG TPA: hypothetical protein VHU89_11280 [Acidobacteriaceae bacterium]|jgi:hypothetical protein|nr:hypothetical protein [Acidobacteriaceae bacterium]